MHVSSARTTHHKIAMKTLHHSNFSLLLPNPLEQIRRQPIYPKGKHTIPHAIQTTARGKSPLHNARILWTRLTNSTENQTPAIAYHYCQSSVTPKVHKNALTLRGTLTFQMKFATGKAGNWGGLIHNWENICKKDSLMNCSPQTKILQCT